MRPLLRLLTALGCALAPLAPVLSAIQGSTWVPIGPGPIQGFFAGGVTGRASAIAVNPQDENEIWLGTANGGVWHSTDNGQTWLPISSNERFLAIGAVALSGCTATGGCQKIYAGTGENAIRRDTYRGGGLLIGGLSGGEIQEFVWTLYTGSPYSFDGGSINNVVLDDSHSPPTIYVTLSSGETVSATEATVTAPEPMPGGYGIYRSTDGGATWAKLFPAVGPSMRPTDLVMDPNNRNVLYAGFLGQGAFKSTDGGNTWCPLNPGVPLPAGCTAATGLPNISTAFDHVSIAMFAGNTSELYASFGQCPERLIQNCVPAIYRSLDSGQTWALRMAGDRTDNSIDQNTNCAAGYSRYTHKMVVHPTNADTVFLTAVSLCKSTDGAQSFARTDAVAGGIIHSDHHDIVFSPQNASHMYSTSDGGFAVSADGGSTWTPRNDDLAITGFQSIAASPLTGSILGTAQDNSGSLWSGQKTWQHVPCCGDGGFSVMDRNNVMTMYAGNNFGSFARSDNGGTSWYFPSTDIPSTDPRLFYAPFIQDSNSPNPLYYGSNRLFRSDNQGVNWTPVSPALAAGNAPEIVTAPSTAAQVVATTGQNVITAIAVAPSNPGRVYIGYYGGQVFTSSSPCASNSCWSQVGAKDLPAAPVTGIGIETNGNAYVTFSGFGSFPRVFKTTDNGGTWNPIVTGLPGGIPANAVSVEPSSPGTVWLGMDSAPDGASVYKSTDGGSTWSPMAQGLPNAPVYQIAVDETHGRVYAATHGRGAYALGRAFISNFEGWVNGGIWDIPVYGQNFSPNQSCTMQIFRRDGTLCASSGNDAMGGAIQTDSNGILVTSNGGFYSGRPVAWGCFNGACINSTPIASCSSSANPVSTVIVACGGDLAAETITGCPPLANPPSTLLGLGLSGLPLAQMSRIGAAAPTGGVLYVTAALHSMDTATALCSISVPYGANVSPDMIISRAAASFNSDPACIAQGLSAQALGAGPGPGEDEFAQGPELMLSAPGLTGGQLFTAVYGAPGQTAACQSVHAMGINVLNQIAIARVTFVTAAGGAQGGSVRLAEQTGLGTCSLTVPTHAGDTPDAIALALQDATMTPGIPGPMPDCTADKNPRDLRRDAGSVITVAATDVEVCVNDAGVGYVIAPDELPVSTVIPQCEDDDRTGDHDRRDGDGDDHRRHRGHHSKCDDDSHRHRHGDGHHDEDHAGHRKISAEGD